jgi:hypothetical protein
MNTSNMTIERTSPLAGYRLTDIINGYYVSRLYLGYTKREAIAKFKKESVELARLANK